MINEKIGDLKTLILEHPLFPKLKDKAILAGWIGGLILIASLCWFLTQPVRNSFLQRAVNRVLEQSGDSRRLEAHFSPGNFSGARTGVYFTVTDSGRGSENLPRTKTAFIFTFIANGGFFPCAAIMGPDGKVEEFIALNSHGKKFLEGGSPGILKLYARRIEGPRL